MQPLSPLNNETELLERCKPIEGLSFAQLAKRYHLSIPQNPVQRKGWVGQAIEMALGTTAGTTAQPDFLELGIELKTIPLNHLGKPAESTHITSISLLTVHKETWLTSQCYSKLKRVLWLPVEGDKAIPFANRRIGQALLWSPSQNDMAILENDWNELTWLVTRGQLGDIHAGLGEYLQIRPKAASSKSLCYGFDEQGNKIQTLPRGFYLRSQFTDTILKKL
jgi:DNA mismatch repair protein MutH